ncbi:n-acylsphingosine amidohydrolase [Fusarium sporotrichioides]|uniref:ceramidase n=1 Tax=Fusarium sporotrichioides TaxID=5514 RepID=A0A395S9P7_FUSSP|nr:n-acylsphingosine amidohydrolase [Fusarium sporotrichioides]
MPEALNIPKFTVDLSRRPEDRYTHIIPHFQESINSCNLRSLYWILLMDLAGSSIGKGLASVSRYILRRVHSKEETAELAGLSKGMDMPMHILVAFNVLLDLLLGCTSGGVRAFDSPISKGRTRMLHFRTLDWGMEGLRHIIVELDFVRQAGGPVVATTITYLGYVGVLTGVRRGLSISLNFRPCHASETIRQRLSFRWNQAMVVLGYRKSISSALRDILLDEFAEADVETHSFKDSTDNVALGISDEYVQKVLESLSTSESSAAYLILCQPERVFLVEKDHKIASIHDSDTFLTACNHDVKHEEDPSFLREAAAELEEADDALGMADLVGLSVERKRHLEALWRERASVSGRRYKQQRDVVTQRDVMKFLEDDEIRNEETHYAVIMDPKDGKVVWRKKYDIEELNSG